MIHALQTLIAQIPVTPTASRHVVDVVSLVFPRVRRLPTAQQQGVIAVTIVMDTKILAPACTTCGPANVTFISVDLCLRHTFGFRAWVCHVGKQDSVLRVKTRAGASTKRARCSAYATSDITREC